MEDWHSNWWMSWPPRERLSSGSAPMCAERLWIMLACSRNSEVCVCVRAPQARVLVDIHESLRARGCVPNPNP
jgi:hypothetical protein